MSGIYQTINIIACCYDENDDNDLTANSDETDGNNFNSKSVADPSAHLPHYPRPNVDIILSLRDPFYRSVMTKFYQSRETIATKMHRRTKAKEVLLLFKNRNTTRGETLLEEDDATATIAITPVRFFKTTWRYKRSETLVEVNETAALRGEYIIRFFCIDHVCTKLIMLLSGIIVLCQKFINVSMFIFMGIVMRTTTTS